jgi:predicted MFS family arabinose efflux permease
MGGVRSVHRTLGEDRVPVLTAMIMVGTTVLTFAGGALSALDWRTAFLVTPAACAISLVITLFLLPKEPRLTRPSNDLLGQVLLGLGIIALLGGIGELGKNLTSPLALGSILLGLVLLIVWFVWESHNEERFFPVSLFRNPMFLGAIVAGFVYNFGNAIGFLQLTNLWQYITGLKTLEVSVWQLPLLLAGVVAGLLIGRMVSNGRLTNHAVVLLGAVMTAVGMVLVALTHSAQSLWAFLPGELLLGAGVVVAAVPYGSLILKVAPAQYFGPVSSSRLTFGQFFYALGFAVSTIMVDKLTIGGTTGRLEAAGVPPSQVGTGLDAVNAYAAQSTEPTTSMGKAALSDAVASYGSAFAITMSVTAVVMLAAGIGGFLLLRRVADEAADEIPESVKHPAVSTSSG